MFINDIKPGPGARRNRKRVGRGIGSGHGKTAGRGHKGQRARSGGYHKVGFEGGQMPLQRRLPKRGFASLARDTVAEIRLSDLQKMKADTIDLAALQAEGFASRHAMDAKVMLSGQLARKVTVKNIGVSKGARAAIEAAGGTIIDDRPKPEPKPESPKKVAAAEAAAKAAEKAKPAEKSKAGGKAKSGEKAASGEKAEKAKKKDDKQA